MIYYLLVSVAHLTQRCCDWRPSSSLLTLALSSVTARHFSHLIFFLQICGPFKTNMVEILKGFIWVSNMTARNKYAFWVIKISSIFSETTRGMEMLPGRNVPYMTLQKICVIFLSIRIPRWSTLKFIFFYIRLCGKMKSNFLRNYTFVWTQTEHE